LPTATDAEILQELIDESDTAAANRKKKSGIVIEGLGDANVRFSRCCSPIPGDAVLGFVTRGRGVSIHRTDCPNIINIGEGDMERIIDANWQLPSRVEDNVSYRADLRMICDARDGLIMDVSRVLTDEKIKVKTLNARILRADAIINIGVEIPGRFQLERLCAKLTNLTGAHEIKRVTT
ncbi:MAG: GTP pyrophosphokinase, partial [Defluviitaleaceae bacterium]|nr:GTP pyrophosphokinase [Defluviitaleaceae bacterium]